MIEALGDKVAARKIAAGGRACPIVPGTRRAGAQRSPRRARFADKVGYPVIIKASGGGGGRGMRVVRDRGRAAPSCSSSARSRGAARRSATTRCSSRSCVERPKHIEVQILGDNHGNLVHLFERDCSVQRRHQKVVESRPRWSLPEALRARVWPTTR